MWIYMLSGKNKKNSLHGNVSTSVSTVQPEFPFLEQNFSMSSQSFSQSTQSVKKHGLSMTTIYLAFFALVSAQFKEKDLNHFFVTEGSLSQESRRAKIILFKELGVATVPRSMTIEIDSTGTLSKTELKKILQCSFNNAGLF